MEKVASIFDEIQRNSSASNKTCIPKLNKVLLSESEEERELTLQSIWLGCLDRCLICAKKENVVDKMIGFLSSFVSSQATTDAVFNSCTKHLLERSRATNKVIRLRACQMLLRVILGTIESGKEVTEDTLKSIIDSLLSRLKDKVPGVRVWAVKVAAQLQTMGDGLTKELARLLQSDTSKDVRVAAVEGISLTKVTLPLIIARVRDVRPEVRIAVYNRLSAKGIISVKYIQTSLRLYSFIKTLLNLKKQNLDAPSKALIVQFGLSDRDNNVKNACKTLILKWLEEYKNDVPKFLRLMDFEMYEDEADSLGYAVMDIVDKSEIIPHDLSIAVRQHIPIWDISVSKMTASEILWVYIRCDYAKNNMSPVAYSDFTDALLPNIMILCQLLQESKKPALYSSRKCQMIVRYLLKLTSFLDISDVCGCKELSKVFEEMLRDTNLPEALVEPMLNSWLFSNCFSSSIKSIKATIQLSKKVLYNKELEINSIPSGSEKNLSNEYSLPGDSDNEDNEDKEEMFINLSSIRSLQILSWSFQQNIGARNEIKGIENYDEIIEFIQSNLSQPCPDRRGLSMKCLGLLALTSEEKCKELHNIIFQVASNEIEENEIRSQALEAIIDMATVYESLYKDDYSLTTLLLRLQEGIEPALLRVGAEGSAKLLFSGRLSDPKLFANLLKFFFLPKLANGSDVNEDDEEEEDKEDNIIEDAYLGSNSRLQQILSVFFHAYFIGGISRDPIVFGCTSDLISDLAMLIRDENLNPNAVTKMTSHLLALCENIRLPISEEYSKEYSIIGKDGIRNYAETARNIFRLRLSAAITREILKMGNSKVEKAAVKEFIKALGTLSPYLWIQKSMASVVLSVTSTIYQTCSVDKSSQKILIEKIISVCEEVGSSATADEKEEEKNKDYFYSFAPGLADLMEIVEHNVEKSKTNELRLISREFIGIGNSERQIMKTYKKPKSKEDEEGEEEEEEEKDLSSDESDAECSSEQLQESSLPSNGRKGLSRNSKVAAASKISSQLSENDTKLTKKKSSQKKNITDMFSTLKI